MKIGCAKKGIRNGSASSLNAFDISRGLTYQSQNPSVSKIDLSKAHSENHDNKNE